MTGEGRDRARRIQNAGTEGNQHVAGGADREQTDDISPRNPWWRNAAIMVPTVVALLGVLVTAYFAFSPRAAPAQDPLGACRVSHPAAGDTATSTTAMTPASTGTSSTFQGCVWPPVPGSDISGFWEVRVRDFVIPNSFDAEQFTDVQIFDTTCPALSLDYQFNSQQTVSHSRFTVETAQTVSGYDGKPVNLSAPAQPVPRAVVDAQGSKLLVLINNRYRLQRVRCSDLGQPSSPS